MAEWFSMQVQEKWGNQKTPKYRKIPKIGPSMYEPLQTRNAKNPPLNRPPPPNRSPPGGLYSEIAPKYKVKQRKIR